MGGAGLDLRHRAHARPPLSSRFIQRVFFSARQEVGHAQVYDYMMLAKVSQWVQLFMSFELYLETAHPQARSVNVVISCHALSTGPFL